MKLRKECFWSGFINKCKHSEFSNYFTKSNNNLGREVFKAHLTYIDRSNGRSMLKIRP
ncbi:hypothetical protein XBO1_2280020 [Xenorhabdus bovienii str. oregonense]|uniref:Transposase n=1 Tax=Xenorhabdus bovienii str. oregonense TaxID=1398202 RepID=A0A077P7B0_XENBV|nr:hypothetical protein XBO1_2280020 [Xenorhabdus bovienii str. oregonense]